MKFTEISLNGAYLIEMDLLEDERGFFARSWCQKEFQAHQLNNQWVQCNISYNKKNGTLRGMHYQVPPYEEVKVVRCTSGAIYDVLLDLRSDSPTFKQWVALELSAVNHRMLYIPKGLAHGFQTLKDNTEVFYQMSEFYHPESARGVRWNDPSFFIKWPFNEKYIISEKDASYSDYSGPQKLDQKT